MKEIIEMARKRASRIICHSKVVAVAFDKRGNFLGLAHNSPRFSRIGGGVHSEIYALRKFGPNVSSILLLRFGNAGALRPIHPCKHCAKVLSKLDIKILLAI